MSSQNSSRGFVGLTLADWGILATSVLLVLSFALPWATFGSFVIRPTNRLELWIPMVVMLPIVLATLVAGRWRYTRWMALVPLVSGFFLIGIDLGVIGAVVVLNSILAGLPWQQRTRSSTP